MADLFSKQKRSQIMSANRSSGNKSTEWRLRARLVNAGLSGWRINVRDMFGVPDFVFERERVAIFVDGCFWHGCKRCRNLPATNRKFWATKIKRNKRRDRAVTRKLRNEGWVVIRFWEHQVRHIPLVCIEKIQKALITRRAVFKPLRGRTRRLHSTTDK